MEQIRSARHFIYAETQYFASRVIAEAICERLMEDDPPEIIIVNPFTADGWLEQVAMDTARTRLLEIVREADHAGRFQLYYPVASDGTPIYVHAKLTIIDDRILRIGSANMNNRSMGLDSECDVFLDLERPVNAGRPELAQTICKVRQRLIAEHCALDMDEAARRLKETGSMRATIDGLNEARGNQGRRLVPLPLKELSDAEKKLGDSALLDPERPDEMFEPIERRGLFRRKGALMRVRLKERGKRRRRR